MDLNQKNAPGFISQSLKDGKDEAPSLKSILMIKDE